MLVGGTRQNWDLDLRNVVVVLLILRNGFLLHLKIVAKPYFAMPYFFPAPSSFSVGPLFELLREIHLEALSVITVHDAEAYAEKMPW